MIDALLTGKLAANPEARTASNGNRYCTARVWVATGAEDRLSVMVIAFDPDTVAGLLAMAKDETVALSGEFTPKVWTDRGGNAKRGLDDDYDGSDPRLCNARTLSGRPCRALKVWGDTRCITYGGIPTGPKTAEWREGRMRIKLIRRVQRMIQRAREFDERHTTKGDAP